MIKISYPSIEKIERSLVEAIRIAVTVLPEDVRKGLEKALSEERDELSKKMLKAIITNVKVAEEEGIPICQDTGIITYYVKVGTKFPYLSKIYDILRNATIKATKEVPLRPNAVDVITGINSGNNVGINVPHIDVTIASDNNELEVIVFPKGGGSEAPSICKVLTPWQGIGEVIRTVLNSIARYGINACPPLVIGIGIGGTFEVAARLAKRALLRGVGKRSNNKAIAELEMKILDLVNRLEIGPLGMGGKVTALDVHIEVAHRHPATLAMALCTSCWALRRAVMRVYSDGSIEIAPYTGL